jgi:hypothetical protein
MTCSYHAKYPSAGTGHASCTCTDARPIKAPGFCKCGDHHSHAWQATWCYVCDKPLAPPREPTEYQAELLTLALERDSR